MGGEPRAPRLPARVEQFVETVPQRVPCRVWSDPGEGTPTVRTPAETGRTGTRLPRVSRIRSASPPGVNGRGCSCRPPPPCRPQPLPGPVRDPRRLHSRQRPDSRRSSVTAPRGGGPVCLELHARASIHRMVYSKRSFRTAYGTLGPRCARQPLFALGDKVQSRLSPRKAAKRRCIRTAPHDCTSDRSNRRAGGLPRTEGENP